MVSRCVPKMTDCCPLNWRNLAGGHHSDFRSWSRESWVNKHRSWFCPIVSPSMLIAFRGVTYTNHSLSRPNKLLPAGQTLTQHTSGQPADYQHLIMWIGCLLSLPAVSYGPRQYACWGIRVLVPLESGVWQLGAQRLPRGSHWTVDQIPVFLKGQ